MSEDLEARIKALEEKLYNDPDKMSTMKATNRLKQAIDSMKGDRESQEDVVWRIIEKAERVPYLEKYIDELKVRINKLERKIEELEGQ
jgi:predicted  nucleic acid-binding Zn-ribbon protein